MVTLCAAFSLSSVCTVSPNQDENFAVGSGRQPITFENPLYATAGGVYSNPAVIHATQVVKTTLDTLSFMIFCQSKAPDH